MDGRVTLRGFDNSLHLQDNWKAVCCTHCGYDMGYDHINTKGMEMSVDRVTCPECFTKQYKTDANYAPDSWRETNAPQRESMAEQAENSDTETYQVVETINAYRVYDFEFPAGFTWDDVDLHEIDWGLQQIRIEWQDGSESRFDMSYGELSDEEVHDRNIHDHHGDQVY